MKKKVKNINELSQTHGKVEEYQPKTLDQIWGDTGMSKYKTLEEDKYMDYLSDMNKSDLQNYAEEVGIPKNSSGLKNRIKNNILNTAMYIRISNR